VALLRQIEVEIANRKSTASNANTLTTSGGVHDYGGNREPRLFT
jgi:hypothetical protein